MKATVKWKEGMAFEGSVGPHTVPMDSKAPLGKDSAPTPKDLLAVSSGGCTAMDVIALLKKHKQLPRKFEIEFEADTASQHPLVFVNATLIYTVEGDVDPAVLVDAVKRSQTQYCSVNAMLSRALPIYYKVFLNGTEVGSGEADFTLNENK